MMASWADHAHYFLMRLIIFNLVVFLTRVILWNAPTGLSFLYVLRSPLRGWGAGTVSWCRLLPFSSRLIALRHGKHTGEQGGSPVLYQPSVQDGNCKTEVTVRHLLPSGLSLLILVLAFVLT